MRLLRSSRGRWYALAVLWVVVLVLGIGGFLQQADDAGEPRPFLDTLYLTLQLATLDYSGSSGPMNWRLEVARFTVPIMAASTVLQTASVVFAAEVNRWRISRSHGHTVVAGLGEVGRRLARSLADAGERVVGIDPDPAHVDAVRGSDDRIAVIVGDPTDPTTLAKLRIERARRLVVATGEDATNVAVATAAASVADGHRGRRTALRCAVQLSDAELATVLRTADLDARGAVRIGYFSLHERAARALLSENPPFEGDSHRPMVIGLGRFGRSLVLALGQQWAHQHSHAKLPLTLVDAHAGGRWAELALRHPGLAQVTSPTLIEVDLGSPSGAGMEQLARALEEQTPTWVAIVVDDEPLALANAVFLQQRLPRGAVPIVVRMGSAAGLGTLVDPVSGSERSFPGVRVFPLLDRTCTVASIEGGVREQLAEAVHEDYLASLDPASTASELRRPWAELDDEERDLSRRRVDGIIDDLAAVGCELVPLRRWGAPELVFTDEETERLASREHQRWYDDRTAAGWTHGEVRDNAAKRNPLLVPWEGLGDEARRDNLEAVRALQPMLARAGFEAVRS